MTNIIKVSRGIFIVLVAGAMWLAENTRADDAVIAPTRSVTADWQNIQGPQSELFHECIGAGRAAEGLRAEWLRQLKMCQDDVGFKAIRFHGLLCDDMGVYSYASEKAVVFVINIRIFCCRIFACNF
jgi:xylan 1,4-beta-xylosidase